jgi:hypothetical protein
MSRSNLRQLYEVGPADLGIHMQPLKVRHITNAAEVEFRRAARSIAVAPRTYTERVASART